MNEVRSFPGEETFDFSVLIPCFNNTEGLITAVKSITYTSKAFIVVVVDDGSNIPVDEKEMRGLITGTVRVIRSSENEGITRSLNKGLAWITEHTNTLFVARLDCGDICHPERFVKQIHFLKQHPGIGLLGSWCSFEDELSGKGFLYKSPAQHTAIVKDMYFRNSFMHASVVMRATTLKKIGFYPLDYEYAEDYALFWNLCKTSHVYILQESLVNCLLNRKGISFTNKNKQLKARAKVVTNLAPNSMYKLLGLVRLQCLRIMPREFILRIKIYMSKMQRA